MQQQPVVRYVWSDPDYAGVDDEPALEPAPAAPAVSLWGWPLYVTAYVVALLGLWVGAYFMPLGHVHKATPGGPVPPDHALREVHRWSLLHPASGHTFVVYHWHPEHPALEHATRVDVWHAGVRRYTWWPPGELRQTGAPCGTRLLAPSGPPWEELSAHDPAVLTPLHAVAHEWLARRALAPPVCERPHAGAECVPGPPAAPLTPTWREDERRFADEWHHRLYQSAPHWPAVGPAPTAMSGNLSAIGWHCESAPAFLQPVCVALRRCQRHPSACARQAVNCYCVRRALAALATAPATPCAACVSSATTAAACACWTQWLAARRALLAQPCAQTQMCRAAPLLVLCAPQGVVTVCPAQTQRPCVLMAPALEPVLTHTPESEWL